MTKRDEKVDQQARDEAKQAAKDKMLERARRTGRKTTLSRLSAKAAKAKPFMVAL